MLHCEDCHTNNYGKVLWLCWKCQVIELLEEIKERL